MASLRELLTKRQKKTSAFMGTVADEKRGFDAGSESISVVRKLSAGKLPSWGDLSRRGVNTTATEAAKTSSKREPRRYATLRTLLILAAIAVLAILYVRHVYATQALLSEVEALRRENIRLHLGHNRVKSEYDRLTNPRDLVEAAKQNGLVEGYVYGETIHIKPKE